MRPVDWGGKNSQNFLCCKSRSRRLYKEQEKKVGAEAGAGGDEGRRSGCVVACRAAQVSQGNREGGKAKQGVIVWGKKQ